jgi:hypothetical protein
MRMFHQFLKTFKEENNVEDSGEEQNSNSSEFSLDTTSLCGENRHLFGHDPITTQDALDALDAIPGIETSHNSIIDPHVSLIVDSRSRQHHWLHQSSTESLLVFCQIIGCTYSWLTTVADNFIDCYSTATAMSHADLQSC